MADPSMPAFTWQTIKTGREGPGPRSRHGLIYDRGEGATVLFGGIVWVLGGRLRSDTWELKDGQWSSVVGFRHPRARHRGAMVFDERRGFSVLFGGQGSLGNMLGDTWTYAAHRWRKQMIRWRRPSSRCGHALACDEEAGLTVLFGGVGRSQRSLGDTWIFDGSSWRKVPGPHPPARRYAAFAFDPDLQGCILHGGAVDDVGARQFGDAWLFRDRTWTRLPPGFETDDRDDHGLAYHWAAGAPVMLDSLRSARGVLAGTPDGWDLAPCAPLHPRHQCSPLAWDDGLDGLVRHGGETRHGGPQFDTTLVLRLAPAAEGRG